MLSDERKSALYALCRLIQHKPRTKVASQAQPTACCSAKRYDRAKRMYTTCSMKAETKGLDSQG
eukprot:475415-Pleurochrysis_carterae.AAC.1